MPFTFEPQRLPEVVLVHPAAFGDERGFFMESYKRSVFAAQGIPDFTQDNHSRSVRGVLRGLHYQVDPFAQGKLVRVTLGEIFDVAVDLRRRSPHLGEWVGVRLSDTNRGMLYVPPGFGHGFLVLSEAADVLYKTTSEYNGAADRAVRWDDARIGIDWPDAGVPPIVSEKDASAPHFGDADLFEGGGS
ncbi:MAG: dTDP-4-dehydrorhamnose 3,5-epimerase [Acidimicrobiia bacterium]